MQFAINTSKPPAPAAPREQTSPVHKAVRGQAVTCLAQLALPHQAGNTQGEAATALNLHSPAATGHPSIQPPSPNKISSLNKKKKNGIVKLEERKNSSLGRDVDPGRLLLRSGVVGHALGGDPPYQRGRRLQPPYAARLVVARRCSVCLKLLAPARSVPAAAS